MKNPSARSLLIALLSAELAVLGAAALLLLPSHFLVLHTAAVVLYSIAILFPRSIALSAYTTFGLVVLLFGGGPPTAPRALVFATLLLFGVAKVPPFILLLALWSVLAWFSLRFPQFSSLLGETEGFDTAVGCFFEVLSVGAVPFVEPLLPRVVTESRREARLTIQNMAVHAVFLPLLTATAISTLVVFKLQPTASPIAERLSAFPEAVPLLFLMLLIIGGSGVRLLAHTLLGGLEAIERSLKTQQDEHLQHRPALVEEMHEIAQLVASKAASSEREILELSTELRISRILQRKRTFQVRRSLGIVRDLRALFLSSPVGIIAVREDATIGWVNPACAQLLEVRQSDLIGKPYNYLRGKHPWQQSLLELVEELMDDSPDSTSSEVLRTGSSYRGKILELFGASLSPLAETKTDISCMILCQPRSAIGDFVREAMYPRPAEVIGAFATRVCRALTAETTRSAPESSDRSTTRTSPVEFLLQEEELRSRIALRGLELGTIKDSIAAALDAYAKVNKSSRLPRIQWHPSPHKALTPHCNNESKEERPEQNHDSVSESVGLSQLWALLIALCDHMGIPPANLSLSLTSERIDAQVARLFPKAREGSYGRLDASLLGRSSLQISNRSSFSSLRLALHHTHFAETILELLAMHLEYLGGFLGARRTSPQSFDLSLYLPLGQHDVTAARASSAEQREPNSHAEVSTVLVATDDDDMTDALREAFRGLPAAVHRTSVDALQAVIALPEMHSGMGFAPGDKEGETPGNEAPITKSLDPFDGATVVVDMRKDNTELRRALDRLHAEYPLLDIIILSSLDEDARRFPSWSWLPVPVRSNELVELVTKRISNEAG